MLSNLGTTPRKFSFEPTQTFFRMVRAIQKWCQNNYSRRCHLLQILPALGSRVYDVSTVLFRIKHLTEFNDTTFKITQCNLHKSAKWPIEKKGGYSSGTLYHTSNGRDAPRDLNTIKYTKNRWFSAALHPLLQNGTIFLLVSANWCFASTISFFFFFFFFFFATFDIIWAWWRENLSLGFFGQLRFNLVCSATDVS